jgi:predicted nucleotidyltransferase
MSATLEDYHRALSGFVEAISRAGDDIACVLLYGSMARGDVRVGESDIDLCVFIRQDVFASRERFLRVLETIVEASNDLLECGLPFQRCHYYSESELQSLDAKFCPIWWGDKTSKIVFGEDIRSRIASTEAGRFIGGTVFFEGRRILLPLSLYLHKETLTAEDRQIILNDLLVIKKAMAQSACNALGAWPDTSDAVEELGRRAPDVDLEVFERIAALRGRDAAELDAEQLRELLRDTLTLIETLNEKIMAETDFAALPLSPDRADGTTAAALK